MSLIELKVPDIGVSSAVNIAEIYVKVGDKINKDDNLLMLETDKATMEVPAESSGIVRKLIAQLGTKINSGDVILLLESDVVTLEPSAISIVEEKPTITSEIDKIAGFASPSIRKLARELEINLDHIIGTGIKGRICADDLQASAVKSSSIKATITNSTPYSEIDFSKFGVIESKPISRIKKISGANLARNWNMIPHVTQFDEADITTLEQFRKELNQEQAEIKISPLAFLIKATVYALKKFPEFNASLVDDHIIYKKYYHLGFAADTINGLVVPVLKDADTKGINQIAIELGELAKLARAGKLKPQDMQGGTFTISSLGGIGGTAFTPIINAPEVAILGISKSNLKPWWNGVTFEPRLILPLSLSYDHRIIDGSLAARFTSYLVQVLSDVRRLIL